MQGFFLGVGGSQQLFSPEKQMRMSHDRSLLSLSLSASNLECFGQRFQSQHCQYTD